MSNSISSAFEAAKAKAAAVEHKNNINGGVGPKGDIMHSIKKASAIEHRNRVLDRL